MFGILLSVVVDCPGKLGEYIYLCPCAATKSAYLEVAGHSHVSDTFAGAFDTYSFVLS